MRYKNIMEFLEKTVKKYPEKIAIVDARISLTFYELRSRAIMVAAALSAVRLKAGADRPGGGDKKPIAILMDKGADSIAAFLGVAYSGNFYTPIDSNMPGERIEKILRTLNPACIIAGKDCLAACDCEAINDYPVLLYEEILQNDICADEDAVLFVSRNVIDADVLYVLFTSGSTGMPKGVVISHRAVIDYIEWVVETFRINSGDRFGNQAPFYFDNSILDIYSALKTGSTMYIIPEKLFTFPMQLLEYLKTNEITTIFWVPSVICMAANLKAVGKICLDQLKRVLFCGEPMPNKQLNIWRRAYPHALYANLYGPTEITDVCTCYIVDREFADSDSLPIGFPCANTDILVLDENQQEVQGEAIGELCVRGTSLAYGYYGNEEKTREAFVQNPLNKYYHEIIYRTGDLVKYNVYGELIYISRKDFQIKHMGHRIELGEIDVAVYSIPSVKSCCCVYDERRKKIVLFYTADEEIQNIKQILKSKIPEYMIPAVTKVLKDMPMNLNGKIDRNSLKELL